MKKIFILASLLMLNFIAEAQEWRKAMLRLREENGRVISVVVNGRRYPRTARTLTVDDLPAGNHFIKIFRYNPNGHGYRNGTLVYEGRINVRPGRIYYGTLNRGRMEWEENCCLDDYGHWNNDDYWDDWNDERNCWNNNHNWDNDHDDRDWDRNRDRDRYDDNSWDRFGNGMSQGRYDQLIQQVRNASFENSKMSVANSALANNRITVNQLVGILRELSFESNKLKFAKDNLRKVTDPRNLYMVNDVFTFQSSKDDWNDYVQQNTNR